MYVYKIFCKGCHRGMTWADQRYQYRRLEQRGYSKDEIKHIAPRCQKCVTKWLKENTA